MKLKLKSAEEFRRLLTALLDDLVDARFHFTLDQDLAKAGEQYAMEIAQSPTFCLASAGSGESVPSLR
jgi:hypothetical protein